MYAEALADVLSYAAGGAASEAISQLVSGSEKDSSNTGVVERAELADQRASRIRFAVAGLVALVLTLSLFRGR